MYPAPEYAPNEVFILLLRTLYYLRERTWYIYVCVYVYIFIFSWVACVPIKGLFSVKEAETTCTDAEQPYFPEY